MLSLAGTASLAAQAARRVVDPVLAVVFPARCPACEAVLHQLRRGPLCEACWQTLPRRPLPSCLCGLGGGPPCPRCRRGLNPLQGGVSLGPYEGSLRLLVHELKYRGRRQVAARLAEELLALPQTAGLLRPPAVLVPVPLHPRRQRERGFNQAELLAREIAARCGLTVYKGALVRRLDTPSQTGLCAAARRANLRQAFVVRRRAAVAAKVVVLVDDVLTTGATARACATALRQAGAMEVSLLTAARVL